jgi:hypothetical protein
MLALPALGFFQTSFFAPYVPFRGSLSQTNNLRFGPFDGTDLR